MSIDPNKIITSFSDCKGTCKTPAGCTCDKSITESLLDEGRGGAMGEKNVKEEVPVSDIAEDMQEEVTAPERGKSCSRCCKNKYYGENGKPTCCSGTHKLEVYDWLSDFPDVLAVSKMVEVQFKNTRKGYYINSNDIELLKGDMVAVEATPGHDIGEVTLTGKLVELQMKKNNFHGEVKRVYRIAKPNDMEKHEEAKAREHKTMLRAREIAEELKLDMKISDVEYQGDGNKAIFYYIADGRVDFRQLIKYYASEFRIKIEMKQIGARQEAGRVGGIGPCGRELCCSNSMSNFVSVSTQVARIQDIPLNPQKLAGQCGKLKCCLNFEVDTYLEVQRDFPQREIVLETKDSSYFHFKSDILSGMLTYSTDKYFPVNLITIPKERVHDIIRQNRKGERPMSLLNNNTLVVDSAVDNKSKDVLEQESITRFDNTDNKERSSRNKNRRKNNSNNRQGDNRRGQNVKDEQSEDRGSSQKDNRSGDVKQQEQRNPRRKVRKNNNNEQNNRTQAGNNINNERKKRDNSKNKEEDK